MFQDAKTALLVDPLLAEDFGGAHALGYRVFPPRVWQDDALPALDAVILSHEHDDHFDFPSLAKLDRAIPIYLSARSSSAARAILGELGFEVRPLVPGAGVTIGTLEVVPFAGDHVHTDTGDEWDTLPFLVRQLGGHGSFFSMVDIPITQQHVEWAAARAMRPGVVSWTNNAMDWSHMAGFLAERVEGTQQCFVNMGVGHKLITSAWGVPQAMVTCAGGFAFTGERAWLNQRVFCVDTESVCAQMAKVYKQEKFVSGVPGQTFVLQGGKLKSIEAAPWLGTAPRESWPSRQKLTGAAAPAAPDYAPATGRRELAAGELDELRAQLAAFAATMLGGVTFRSLCSLLDSECDGRRATIAIALRDGDRRHAFAYEPGACAFAPTDEPNDRFIAGIECWAADFHAVLAGRLGPIALTFDRARLWSTVKRFRFDIFPDLYRASHPLRQPAAYLETYRRLAAGARDVAPIWRAKRPAL